MTVQSSTRWPLRDGTQIDEGGDIKNAPSIDQSAWACIEQFDSLAGRNAQATEEEMEWA